MQRAIQNHESKKAGCRFHGYPNDQINYDTYSETKISKIEFFKNSCFIKFYFFSSVNTLNSQTRNLIV